jgi:hypothetical protein
VVPFGLNRLQPVNLPRFKAPRGHGTAGEYMRCAVGCSSFGRGVGAGSVVSTPSACAAASIRDPVSSTEWLRSCIAANAIGVSMFGDAAEGRLA